MQGNGFASKTGAQRRRLFFVSVIALLLMLLNLVSGGKISVLVRDAVAPLEHVGFASYDGIADSGFFTSRGALEAQISTLQSQLQQDQLEAAAFQALQQQNQSLSQYEHLSQTTQGFTAQVTSSIISSPYGTFTIGAGSTQGVTVNDLVLTPEGFVVGKVVQVQAGQSLVDEVFAPGAQTPVTIDGAAAVATGQGGSAQSQVPHGVTVTQGDPVTAPEFGDRPVGTVAYIDSNPANAEQAVSIALPVSLSSLQFVYVTP